MKMNRRKALIGIGSLAIGSGAALGSGAFTQVTANRAVTIEVTDDSDGLLGISPGPSNNEYVTADNDDNAATALSVSITSSELGTDAGGLNNQATVELDEIIKLKNNAGQSITVETSGTSSGLEVDLDSSTDSTVDSSVQLSNDGDTTNVDLKIITANLNNGEQSEDLTFTVTTP